jgi:MoxR-like ATPase
MNHKFNKIPNQHLKEIFKCSIDALNEVVIGQEFQLGLFFSCLIAKEHVAFVGESGCGKTYLVDNFVEFFQLDKHYETITGHPEIMPGDFTVKHVMKNQEIFSYPIKLQKDSTAIFFVDEYNRISPKSLNVLLKPLNDATMDDEINDIVKKVGYNLNKPETKPGKLSKTVEKRIAFINYDDLIKKVSESIDINATTKRIFTSLKELEDEYMAEIDQFNRMVQKEQKIIDHLLVLELSNEDLMNLAKKFEDSIAYNEDSTKRLQEYENEIKNFIVKVLEEEKRKHGDSSERERHMEISFKLDAIDSIRRQKDRAEHECSFIKDLIKTCQQKEPFYLKGLNKNSVLEELNKAIEHLAVVDHQDGDLIENISIKVPVDDEYFFFCVLANNPTSRGGNFPPPDALLDRLGMEVLFYPLTADQKANIPEREDVLKTVATARIKINELINKNLNGDNVDVFEDPIHFFKLINDTKEHIRTGEGEQSQINNKNIKAWCKEFLGAIKSPRQFITEALDLELMTYFRENKDKMKLIPEVSIVRQYTYQWGDDLEADILEVASDKITKAKIMKKFKANSLAEAIFKTFSAYAKNEKDMKKEAARIVDKLAHDLEIDLPFISGIVVGTSGRMAKSMESLIKSYAFVENALSDKSEEFLLPPTDQHKSYYRDLFEKIGYAVSCHRIRFSFGAKRSTKRKVIEFAVSKAFNSSPKS